MIPERLPRAVEDQSVLDLAFVLLTLAFFGVSWAYVRACERI